MGQVFYLFFSYTIVALILKQMNYGFRDYFRRRFREVQSNINS